MRLEPKLYVYLNHAHIYLKLGILQRPLAGGKITGNEVICFTTSSVSSCSVWITFGSIMFSITSLNIQWGTQSATCEKMAHSRAHCPFRSRERPFQLLQWSLRSAWWARHERRMRAFLGNMIVLFKFLFKLPSPASRSRVFLKY